MNDLREVVAQLMQDQPDVRTPPPGLLRQRAAVRRRKWIAAAAIPALLAPVLVLIVASRDTRTAPGIASGNQGPIRDGVIRVEACPGGAPRPELVCGSTENPNEIERLANLLNRAQTLDRPPCQPDRNARVYVVFYYAVDATPVNVYEPDCAVIDEDVWGKQLRMSEDFVRRARALLRPQTEFSSTRPGCQGLIEDLDVLARGLGGWPPLSKELQDNVSRLETRIRNDHAVLTPEQRAATQPLIEGWGNGSILNSLLLGAPAEADDRLRQALQELRAVCP